MATTLKSTNPKNATRNPFSTTILSSWPRQQKPAVLACFAILGLLFALSACSKQSPKTPLAEAANSTLPSAATITPAAVPMAAAWPVDPPRAARKTRKKRPANVTYSDPTSGVSFLYPRKSALTSGNHGQPMLAGVGDLSMNFVQPGGVAVATVALPTESYPGTDFASAFFNVNVNRSLSEQECKHFALVDTRDADGEPVDAEKIKVGSNDMEMTSSFSASAVQQAETQYYHHYENGACYEYVLGLGTEGFATQGGIQHVNRDEVFAKLEKILATVKINPVEQQKATESPVEGIIGGKE